MRFKPTPELCYLAGLAGRSNEPEQSIVGVRTQNEEIEQRFVQYAIKLGTDTKKILIEESEGGFRHVYTYNSKLAKMIREIMKERASLARKRGNLAAAFIAGTFDANGHVSNGALTIRKLEKGDELLLELLGVHSVNSKIMNIRGFLSLIKKDSILADSVKLG
jgi:hypothetical protein